LLEHPDDIGIAGEHLACTHLKEKGYNVLEKNWRAGRYEIDIIAEKNNVVCFVEVKTRENRYAGDPALAVTRAKQKHVIKAADVYVKENDVSHDLRFDIIAVVMNRKEVSIEHIEDAFYPLL
jgi:putative endonuclease